MTPEETLVHQTATYAYAGALVDELAHAGVRHACVCPGSRSTPLAYALAGHPAIETWAHVDERSGSFFALGLAKSLREPVALVCTSGTAAANFLPAVVEARYGRVPLIVLTADRPPELRDNGAPQAIDQVHLYGRNAKWFVDMALPEGGEEALRYARATAARAAATALAGPSGPVHLNMPFREPLTPPRGAVPAAPPGRPHGRPYTRAVDAELGVGNALIEWVNDFFVAARRGIIVCGAGVETPTDRYGGDYLQGQMARLAGALGWPILADPLSRIRCGTHDREAVIDTYDAFLRDDRASLLAPDVVLRFGAPPTSKALQTLIGQARRHILVDPYGEWRDPTARIDALLRIEPRELCQHLLSRARYSSEHVVERDWLEAWRGANAAARAAMSTYLDGLDEPFEGKVFVELADLLPDGATLFAGNSMPVRDLDTFFPSNGRRVQFLSNRGANGIDGVVSSALGVAAAGLTEDDEDPYTGSAPFDGPLVLVIGDLSFYHDLNGLLAAKRYPIDATIILLNNDGGGIFSFLPQAANPDHFEELFGTPTGLDFKPIVEAYGCGFERVTTWREFRDAVGTSIASPGVQVVELRTGRDRNVALHRAVWKRVAEAVWRA